MKVELCKLFSFNTSFVGEGTTWSLNFSTSRFFIVSKLCLMSIVIYSTGENIIGRHDNCDITIPLQASIHTDF